MLVFRVSEICLCRCLWWFAFCGNFYHVSVANLHLLMINGIYHRSSMQTEKSQPEDKRIMPERRFDEFPALSVDPRVWISRSTY